MKKDVQWIGSSKRDIKDLPSFVQRSFGHSLWGVQKGHTPEDAKPLFELGRGIYEIRESFDTNAYRLMYVACFEKAVYVLHVFMKKSKSGIGVPKPDIELIKTRYKMAIYLEKGE